MSKKTGTKEWSGSTVNCVTGCEHDCLYCYARHMSVVRMKRVTADRWPKMFVRMDEVMKRRGKRKGVVMFPSAHDITPSVVHECLVVIRKLVDAGNHVLVVTKPHREVIQQICQEAWRDDITFRFSIGMKDDYIRKIWEPNAPSVEERIDCLEYADAQGFRTSISAEPLLEPWNALQLYLMCEPFLTKDRGAPAGEFWIGKLNRIADRVRITSKDQRKCLEKIQRWQTDANVMHIVQLFRHHGSRHIRWKETYQTVIDRQTKERR